MVDIPKKYNQDIQKMIDWHLSVYMPSIEFDIMLNRILEHFFTRNLVDGVAQLEEKELSYLKDCASDAINYADECGIDKDTLWNIADWAQEEREKHNV